MCQKSSYSSNVPPSIPFSLIYSKFNADLSSRCTQTETCMTMLPRFEFRTSTTPDESPAPVAVRNKRVLLVQISGVFGVKVSG